MYGIHVPLLVQKNMEKSKPSLNIKMREAKFKPAFISLFGCSSRMANENVWRLKINKTSHDKLTKVKKGRRNDLIGGKANR